MGLVRIAGNDFFDTDRTDNEGFNVGEEVDSNLRYSRSISNLLVIFMYSAPFTFRHNSLIYA